MKLLVNVCTRQNTGVCACVRVCVRVQVVVLNWCPHKLTVGDYQNVLSLHGSQ